MRKYLHAEVRKTCLADQGPLEYSAVVQSTLRRVWQRIDGQFADGPEEAALRRFLGWVSKIARNRLYEEQRRIRRERRQLAGATIKTVHAAPPADAWTRRDRIAVEVAASVAALPEHKRQVVELFWFERLSDVEIGERLGRSAGAVRVLRWRALRALRTSKLQSLLEESHDDRR